MTATAHHMTAPDPATPGYLQGLNPQQREAVEAVEGPVLVLAGAGTGKTRVLTTRLAHVLNAGYAAPGEILAVTFTNKAANEMKGRVADLLGGQPVEGMWLGTFHALGARMLRRNADLAGLTSQFTIIDPDDQQRLLKQLMQAENIDVKKSTPKAVAGQISKWKDRGLTPGDVPADEIGDLADGRLGHLYRQYQQRLREINAADFGDLLLHMITIFRNPEHKHILDYYQQRLRYIMVDEYQDTNVAQYLWLRFLAQGHNNICCVGDDDQSIYGWRGAEVGNILRFEHDFPGARVVRLEENYRSTQTILSAAGEVIANNQGRHEKHLKAQTHGGAKITVRGLWDGGAEARWVGEEIEALHNTGWRLNQIAVLVRAGFQMRTFEERFMNLGLAYRVVGGPRFYERQEIRDALAYFRQVVQPDDDLALERIINTPKRGIGDSTLQTLYSHARSSQVPLHQAIEELCETDEIRPQTRTKLNNLMQDFARWRARMQTIPHTELAGEILDESGYTAMWQNAKTPDATGRLDNLKEMISAMEEFDSLPAFLEHVALVLENQEDSEQDKVTLMTLHGAKGLEFDCVFLTGWEEGLFPSQRTMDEHGIAGLEEERRLAYVGMTRARQRAYISYAANRQMYGSWTSAIPSRFIDELPEDYVESESEIGAYGPGRSSHWDSSGFSPRPGLREQNPGQIRQNQSPVERGARVAHDKFGYGTVLQVEGKKLDIDFDETGHKRVMAGFVRSVEN